jgi:hypothetical protein
MQCQLLRMFFLYNTHIKVMLDKLDARGYVLKQYRLLRRNPKRYCKFEGVLPAWSYLGAFVTGCICLPSSASRAVGRIKS